MGEVVGAGLLAHVPTIMLPRAERLELNEGQEISLVPGLERLRAEVFETLDYDTVLVFDSHWFTTVEFVISSHEVRAGLFTSVRGISIARPTSRMAARAFIRPKETIWATRLSP